MQNLWYLAFMTLVSFVASVVSARDVPSKVVAHSVSEYSSERHLEGNGPKIIRDRYTLLGRSTYFFGKKFHCEIIVMVDFHRSSLKIIRLGGPHSKNNGNALRRSPANFENFGTDIFLSDLFPEVELLDLEFISTRFEKKEKQYNLKVTAHMKSGHSTNYILPIGEYYKRPKGKKCLM